MAVPAEERHGAQALGYMPALDGIRALAVLGVMGYHGGVSFLRAGFFGVDAFFVLSGFLITSLLVGERSATGRLALGRFWGRRARRLLPALLAMIVAVVVYVRFVAPPGAFPGLRWDAAAALFYSANWRFVAAGQSYFGQTGPVSPLLHTWTLAIEEQFYILWPLVVAGVAGLWWRRSGSRRALGALTIVALTGAAASAVEMAVLYRPDTDPTRAYFGTDTHAQCLLVGAALAALTASWRERRGTGPVPVHVRPWLSAAGLAGVAVCAVVWSQLRYPDALVFRGGFSIVALAVAAVVLSVVAHPEGVVARGLAWRPLRFLGRISYGMYLWHFPLFSVLDASSTGLHGAALFGLRVAATVAAAVVSFYGLERPIRTAGTGAARRLRLVAPVAVAATAAVVVASTVVPAATAVDRPVPPATPGATATTAGAPVRVMLVGDSVAFTLGYGLGGPVAAQWHITLADLAILGCGVMTGKWAYSDQHGVEVGSRLSYACWDKANHGYVPYATAWRSWLREVEPNVVVLLAGRWEVANREFDGHLASIVDPAFAAHVKATLEADVRVATSTGARLVLETSPCFDQGEQADGTPFPEDDVRRVRVYNRLVREVAAEFPHDVAVQDLFALTCPGGRFRSTLHGVSFRPDGVHFDTSGHPGVGSALLAGSLLPGWALLGHEQEAEGGTVATAPLPAAFSQQ